MFLNKKIDHQLQKKFINFKICSSNKNNHYFEITVIF